jgi:tetratricopeptide (TPR) repeat protein
VSKPVPRLLLAVGLIVVATSAAAAQSRSGRSPSATRIEHDLGRLREWFDAVHRHQPATPSSAATLVASWSRRELEVLLLDFKAFLHMIVRPESSKFPRGVRSLNGPELEQLQELAEAEAWLAVRRSWRSGLTEAQSKRLVNQLVKRGALLHTDIALLVPSAADRLPESANEPRLLLERRGSVLVQDGRQEGTKAEGAHWDVARLLLDEITPDASRNATARLWYRAIAAFFEKRALLAESVPHLERGRRIYATDPFIFAASGLVHETFAAPEIQTFVQTAAQSGLPPTSVGSARSNLRRAEEFFRRAVELDGSYAEARVHLGRVLGLQGRHEEAASQLQQATATAHDSLTRYYAWLFLGAEEQWLGHADRARQSFDAAVALFPRAQSPHLALSQLARRNGDRGGALRAIQQVLNLPADDSQREDPWWAYFHDPGDKAEAMMHEMRAALFLPPEEH